MTDHMILLRNAALRDDTLRERILATTEETEQLSSLCAIAQELGIALTPEEIIASGEEDSSNQTKSTNGGNPLPYDCFDDAYEMFIYSLRR